MKSVIFIFLFLSVINYFIDASYPQYSGGGYVSEAQPLYSHWRAEPNYPPAPNPGSSFQLQQSESHYVPPQRVPIYAHTQPESSYLQHDPNYAQNQYEPTYVPPQEIPDFGVNQPELNYAPLNQDIPSYAHTQPESSYLQHDPNYAQNQYEPTYVPPQEIPDFGVNQPELNYAPLNQDISAQQQKELIFAQRHHEINPEQEFLFAKTQTDANYAEAQPQNLLPQRYPELPPYPILPETSYEGYPIVLRQQTWPQATNHAFSGDKYPPQARNWSPNSYIPNESISQEHYPSPAEAYPWHSNKYQNAPPSLQDNYYGSSYEKQVGYKPLTQYPQSIHPQQSIQQLQAVQNSRPVYQPQAVQQSQHILQSQPNQQPQSIQHPQPIKKLQYEKLRQLPPQTEVETEVAENAGIENNAEKESKKQVKEMVTQKKRFILMYPNGTTEQVDVLDDTLIEKAYHFKSGDIYTEKDIKQKLRINNLDQRALHQSDEGQNRNDNDIFYQNRPHKETPQNEASIESAPKRVQIETATSGYAPIDNVGTNKKIYRPRYRFHDQRNIVNRENYSPTVKTIENNNDRQNPVITPTSGSSDYPNHAINKQLPQFPSMWRQNYRKPNESQKPIKATVSQDDNNENHIPLIDNNNQYHKTKYTYPIKSNVENFQYSSTYKSNDPIMTYNQSPNLGTQSTNDQNNSVETATIKPRTWIQNNTNVNDKVISTNANNADEPYNNKSLVSANQMDKITLKPHYEMMSPNLGIQSTNDQNNPVETANTKPRTWIQNNTNVNNKVISTNDNNADEPYNNESLVSANQMDKITLKPHYESDFSYLNPEVSYKNGIKNLNGDTSSNVPSLNPGYENATTEAHKKEEPTDSSAWAPHDNYENAGLADYANDDEISGIQNNSPETDYEHKIITYVDDQTAASELSYVSGYDYFYTTESNNIVTLSPVEKTSTNIVDYTTDYVAASTPSTKVVADAENSHTTVQPLEYEDDRSEIVKDLGTLDSNDILPFWIGTDDQLWEKALEENNNAIYVFNVNIKPTIVKLTKIFVFENGTTVEETSETVWDIKDDIPKELKIILIIRNPRTDELDDNEEEESKRNE